MDEKFSSIDVSVETSQSLKNDSSQTTDTIFSKLRFFEALDRINRIIIEATGIDSMLEDCLEEMLDTLDCDRAWLLRPCNPNAPVFRIEMQRTKPAYPSTGMMHIDIPTGEFHKEVFARVLSNSSAHVFDPSSNPLGQTEKSNRLFGVQSQMVVAIHPKDDELWCLGIGNCEEPRTYTWEIPIFEEVGRRLVDGLTSLLTQRNLHTTE
jgi:hypothetical protein